MNVSSDSSQSSHEGSAASGDSLPTLTIPFSAESDVALSAVGGKGYSLIRMFRAGLAVPPGFVLTVDFFEPWLETLKQTDAWQTFVQGSPEECGDCCADLQAASLKLPLEKAQQEAIEHALADCSGTSLFAVRSSSPEEDLEGSSFAGAYETVLGVTRDTLDDAVHRAFASCLDQRIVVYKEQNGFDIYNPRIAVVVQQQIASEVAGVGFSVNPVNNDYDEAVFSANWGLGETVVAGIASPDLFVVNKQTSQVIERTIGAKETSIWLTSGGGTEERADPRHDELTLTDSQVLVLTGQLIRIESLYGKPMDIEWAFADGRLYLLQARPITTHVPLHPDMMTKPGEPRRLYLDATISIQAIFDPLSPMGESVLHCALSNVSQEVFGMDILANVAEALPIVCQRRLYMNASNLLYLFGKEKWAAILARNFDPLAASAIAEADDSYASTSFKKWDKIWGVLGILPQTMLHVIEGRLVPGHVKEVGDKAIDRWQKETRAICDAKPPLGELATEMFRPLGRLIFSDLMPMIIVARRSIGKIGETFADEPEDIRAKVHALDQALPGNVTVEMGLNLCDVAEKLGDTMVESADALEQAIDDRSLPQEFIDGWDAFLDRYGHRGNKELDIAQPRYRDEPGILLQQIVQLRTQTDPQQTPLSLYEKAKHARQEAYELLDKVASKRSWATGKRFRSLYKALETLGGVRETHKFLMIKAIDHLRERLLEYGREFVDTGRLDAPEQVFDLFLEDVEVALADGAFDIRTHAAERRAVTDRLAQIPQLPVVIDSRGRILRPPVPPAKEGELVGQPISSGVIRGPVKVLHEPDEKPLLPGDILVARATDPGWTPLFVNAGAIVLEIGGLLQHGALVAREYGKPCVAGIANATSELRDGQLVEVDGDAGVVRLQTSNVD